MAGHLRRLSSLILTLEDPRVYPRCPCRSAPFPSPKARPDDRARLSNAEIQTVYT